MLSTLKLWCCFVVFVEVCQAFAPLWHQPNDFDLEGQSCELQRPSLLSLCPPFGVLVSRDPADLTRTEVENACVGLNPQLMCNGRLFPDGTCGECPPGMSVKEVDGDVYCEGAAGKKLFHNPFNCVNGKHRYRPCNLDSPVLREANISHYYSGSNLQQQQILEACAIGLDLQPSNTTINITPIGSATLREFPFPLISDKSTPREFGFLECPTAEEESYSFTTAFWLVLYSSFALGVAIILLFCVYKLIREPRKRGRSEPVDLPVEGGEAKHPWDEEQELIEMTETASKNKKSKMDKQISSDKTMASSTGSFFHATSGIEFVDDSSQKSTFKQIGYRRDPFGSFAFFVLVMMSVGWLLLLLLIVLDFYGMHLWSFCDDAARQTCQLAKINTPQEYLTLRNGYACASGCLFSWNWTSGVAVTWPYFRSAAGGHQIDAVFILVWHLALVWFIGLKAIQTTIRSFFSIRCSLDRATTVLITRPKEAEVFVEGEADSVVLKTAQMLDNFRDKHFGGSLVTVACKVIRPINQCAYIDFQCVRYCWSDAAQKFVRAGVNVGKTFEEIRRAGGGLTTAEANRRYQIVGGNSMAVEVPPTMKAIFLEFFDWFYLYQFFCLWVWFAFYYWTVGLVILGVVVASGFVKVYTRRQSQLQVREMAQMSSAVMILRDGIWDTVSSNYLVPGDILKVERGLLVCDSILLEGTCVCDESSLTGEPTPVPKISLGTGSDGARAYSPSGDALKYTLLAGTSVEAVRPGPNGFVIALVMATGAETEKGKLIRDMMYPPPLSFKFDQHWKLVFLILLCWGCVVFGVCVRMVRGNLVGWYYGLATISQIMSPLIPAVFVASRANSAIRLTKNHGIRCVNFERILVCGKVKIFCFDKTGTLTKPGLDVHSIIPINHATVAFDPAISADRRGVMSAAPDLVKLAMASTHELVLGAHSTNNSGPLSSRYVELVGNEVDQRMFEASGFELISDGSSIEIRNGNVRMRVLRRFEFDRLTMSMSAIVEDMNDPDSRYVFVKGTFESILAASNGSALPTDYLERARGLARDGYYTIGIGYKTYTGPADVKEALRTEVESELTPMTLLVFLNDLKPEAPSVIRELKEGSIRPVMITGDSALTAISIARLCGLSTAPRIVLGDANKDPSSIVDWRDVDSGEAVDPWKDRWRDLETGQLELALTGHAFEKLAAVPLTSASRDPFALEAFESESGLMSSQLRALLRYTRIFARMKPDQKVQAIKLHMANGVTAMCGDGANDAGALRMAHVGLALGNGKDLSATPALVDRELRSSSVPKSTDATVVAPFSTASSSLRAATLIIKEGRCALATSIAAYKNLMVYGEVMVAISFVMYYFGVNLSESYWVTVDAFINIGMSWAIMQAKPNSVLTSVRPSSKLLGSEVISSVLLQICVNTIFLAVCMSYLFSQDFFACREFDANLVEQGHWWEKADNYEAVVIAILSLFQLINAGAIFNFGFDYRQSWRRNHWVVFFWCFGLVFGTLLLFAPPSTITCLYRINCGDNSLLDAWREMGKISSFGGPVSTAPDGCPCSEQVGFSETCENEYLNCTASHYKQTFHHNILPYAFRGVFFVFLMLNTALGFFLEWFFIVGPIRRKLRHRKAKLQTQAKLLSAGMIAPARAPFGTAFIDGPISRRLRSPSVIVGAVNPMSEMSELPASQRSIHVGIGGVGIGGGGEFEGEISTRHSRRSGSPTGTPPSVVGKPGFE